MTTKKFSSWELDTDKNGFSWLGFDLENKTANVLTQGALKQLYNIIDNLSFNSEHKGLVIYSKKDSGFIFGADILSFSKYSADEIRELLDFGQKIFSKLENLNNTICLIDGLCLGGGLELALACDYRIITSSSKLGLPEVTLGIQPGWGGTVRLPKIVGLKNSLTMMITGRSIDARKCKKFGLANEVVPSRQLKNAALWYLNNSPKVINQYRSDLFFRIPVVKKMYSQMAMKKLQAKVKQKHYPAPYEILKNWSKITVNNKKSYVLEKESFLKLITQSDTARNLMRVYALQQKLKKAGSSTTEISHVHVVGAGIMGGDIAAWCALKGFKVSFQDVNIKTIPGVIKRAHTLFKFKLKNKHLYQGAIDRLIPDYEGSGLKSADIIIEAVSEDIRIKKDVWKNINKNASPTAILATNTSSLPLNELSSFLDNPKRLIGVHFFNPVSRMPLVEVIYDQNRESDFFKAAVSFVKKIGKLPLPVKSSPGFLVNRILMPYIVESFRMLEEGFYKEEIDCAAKDFGMPMGPIELADVVGLDVCIGAGDRLKKLLGGNLPKNVDNLVKKGKLGYKTGEGFYQYKNGKKIDNVTSFDKHKLKPISERLYLIMLNEANKSLAEKIVDDSDLLDAGMIFGTGFSPFKGGPIHYSQSRLANK